MSMANKYEKEKETLSSEGKQYGGIRLLFLGGGGGRNKWCRLSLDITLLLKKKNFLLKSRACA